MFFSQCSRAKLALLSIRQKLPQLAAGSSDAPLRTRRRRAAVPVSPRRPGPALTQRRRRTAGSPRPAACGGAKPERKPPGGRHGTPTPTAGPLRRPAANPPAPSRRRQPPRHRLLPSVRPSLPRPCPRRPCRTSAAGAAGSGRCLPLSAPVPLALGAGPAPPPAPASACGWRRVLSQALLDFLLLLESREVGV